MKTTAYIVSVRPEQFLKDPEDHTSAFMRYVVTTEMILSNQEVAQLLAKADLNVVKITTE